MQCKSKTAPIFGYFNTELRNIVKLTGLLFSLNPFL